MPESRSIAWRIFIANVCSKEANSSIFLSSDFFLAFRIYANSIPNSLYISSPKISSVYVT
jgi:hypothetical protein